VGSNTGDPGKVGEFGENLNELHIEREEIVTNTPENTQKKNNTNTTTKNTEHVIGPGVEGCRLEAADSHVSLVSSVAKAIVGGQDL